MTANPEIYPHVSVIVPVYNDCFRVGKCIQALLRQTYPEGRYEIIVVDNGSSDDTSRVLGGYPVKVLFETEKKSSYAARNKGVMNSRGDVLAFTDADCVPHPDWIEKGVKALLGWPDCGLAAGKIDLFYKRPGDPNPVELYETIKHFRQKDYIEREHFGATANVFTFRSVFDEVGPFNEKLKSGGDNEWGKRVYARGYQLAYVEDAVVAHPARCTYKELHNRVTRIAGGSHEQQSRRSARAYCSETGGNLKNILAYFVRVFLGEYDQKNLTGMRRKISFFRVAALVELFRIWERTRLYAGGTSRR